MSTPPPGPFDDLFRTVVDDQKETAFAVIARDLVMFRTALALAGIPEKELPPLVLEFFRIQARVSVQRHQP